jgi:hypothetical protein
MPRGHAFLNNMLRGLLVAASLCILLPIGGGNEAFDDATDVCSCADGSTYLYGNFAAASLPHAACLGSRC